MLSNSKYLFLLAVLGLHILSCKPSSEVSNKDTIEEAKSNFLPDDFLDFYEKFHSDPDFQFTHIVFPLEGKIYSEDNVASMTTWNKDNWILHRPFDEIQETFTRSYTEFGGIISEKIEDNQGLLSMERRFSKIQGKWHLIFYDPIHLAKH